MDTNSSKLLTNKLKICENCEWCYYSGIENEFAKCMLSHEIKGLVEHCNKFKYKTGNHFTIYY